MFEIKTKDLIRSRDASNAVIDGILGKTLDVKEANTLNNAVGGMIRIVSTELKVRLAAEKLLESDAKLIEISKKSQTAIETADTAQGAESKAA